MTDAPYLSPPLDIETGFLDHNGHVNMAYHVVLADRALDLAFTEIKGADYVGARGMTTFAAEMHVRYLQEMNMGDEIRGRVLFAAADEKRAHWIVELVRPDGDVVTTAEGVSLSVEVGTRQVVAFPDDIVEKLLAVAARDATEAEKRDWVGRRVAMRKQQA